MSAHLLKVGFCAGPNVLKHGTTTENKRVGAITLLQNKLSSNLLTLNEEILRCQEPIRPVWISHKLDLPKIIFFATDFSKHLKT